MSDQHRGAWGAREDAVWWPGAIAADQNNLHHQQIINQHHQQNHMQQQPQQQIHQVVVQQQSQALNDLNRSNSTTSTVATQQLFSYKMASSFPTSGVTVSTSNAPAAYDYRLGMGTMVSRPGDPQGMTAAPGTQWWYATAGQNTLENLQQQQHQHQQQVTQQQQQQNQPQQQQQHQTQHNVHSTPNTVRAPFTPHNLIRSDLFT
jgi:high mobility group protein B1